MKIITAVPSMLPSAFDAAAVTVYCEGAPDFKHAHLRALWTELLNSDMRATRDVERMRILDIGGGERRI